MHRIRSASLLTTAFLILSAGACAKSSSNADSAAARTDSAAAASAAATPAVGTSTGAAPAPAPSGAMLDPNTATKEQLAAVPGMTTAAADALVAGRPYANMVAVDQALAKQLADSASRKRVYAAVWKPIDANTATGPEILLIPGVGPKMRHEFEEYRPWKSYEQFRREIGKYVDKAEVARLEKYISIK